MRYIGSKARLAKYLVPIITKNRGEDQVYIEPFAGACNMICEVKGERVANDINYWIMLMFEALTNQGWIPPTSISEKSYGWLKSYMPLSPFTAFAGIGCSYGGKWFGGYARGTSHKGFPRNYAEESKNNLLKMAPKLYGTTFTSVSYERLDIPSESLVYCDPPYKGATGYDKQYTINYEHFWTWVRNLVLCKGCDVYISEYEAPRDFECVWEKEVNSSLTKDTGSKKNIERLFHLGIAQ